MRIQAHAVKQRYAVDSSSPANQEGVPEYWKDPARTGCTERSTRYGRADRGHHARCVCNAADNEDMVVCHSGRDRWFHSSLDALASRT